MSKKWPPMTYRTPVSKCEHCKVRLSGTFSTWTVPYCPNAGCDWSYDKGGVPVDKLYIDTTDDGGYTGAYAGAYRKGKKAAKDGLTIDANPYDDHRTYRGSVTFARAFIRAWNNGFCNQKEGRHGA